LEHFDERTWQMELASAKKNRALAQLDAASLIAIFGRFSSVDPELPAYTRARAQRVVASQYLLSMPCIFRGTNDLLLLAPEAARTNKIVRQLVGAEATLRATTTNLWPAIERINGVLDTTQGYTREAAGWSAAYYGGLAVKACLRLGKAAEAKSILLRSLEMEPDSVELAYLSRIMAREGILQASEVPLTLSHPDKE
jgi:hypothetical protein